MESAGNGNILVQLSNLKFDCLSAISHVTAHSAMDGQLPFSELWARRVEGDTTGPRRRPPRAASRCRCRAPASWPFFPCLCRRRLGGPAAGADLLADACVVRSMGVKLPQTPVSSPMWTCACISPRWAPGGGTVRSHGR